MARRTEFKADRHVCIFELERKERLFTGDVVCTVCGAKLSSQHTSDKKDTSHDIEPQLNRSSER